jgi:hypothetical protein
VSTNPFRASHEQSSDRQMLSAAFRAGANFPASTRTYKSVPGKLLPHYVSGRLRQLEHGRFLLDARLNNDLMTVETVTFDAATEVYSLYGPDFSMVPIGSRVEAGTPDDMRAENGTRHANWVNVNAIYSHGDVISVNSDSTITLQQAHGGSVRTLFTDSARGLNTTTGDLSGVESGDHVFFTGLAENSELSCPRIHLITLNQMSATPSDD